MFLKLRKCGGKGLESRVGCVCGVSGCEGKKNGESILILRFDLDRLGLYVSVDFSLFDIPCSLILPVIIVCTMVVKCSYTIICYNLIGHFFVVYFWPKYIVYRSLLHFQLRITLSPRS